MISNNPLECSAVQRNPSDTIDVITLLDVNNACLATGNAVLNITGSGYSTCADMDYFLFSRVVNTGCSADSQMVRKCLVLNGESSGSCEIRCPCTRDSLDPGNGVCNLVMTQNPLTAFNSVDLCLVIVVF